MTISEDSVKITTRKAFIFLKPFRILLNQQPCKFLERNGKIGKGTLIFPKRWLPRNQLVTHIPYYFFFQFSQKKWLEWHHVSQK